MFTRARLRIAALYASLMAILLVLLAGAIIVQSARETRRADDLELRLRAEGLAGQVTSGQIVPDSQTRADDDRRGRSDDHEEREGRLGLEREGILAYVLPVQNGKPVLPPTGAISELPDGQAAADTLATGAGRFHTLETAQGQVRLYSLPVTRDGLVVAVVQVARSRYFVETALSRLLLAVLGLGVVGLIVSAGAGFWLAGRTLRPIAAAMRRQREFTADASHELRTPLTLIRGNAELLARHPDRPIAEYADVVQDIVDESDRLGRLVADLLTLARADADHPQPAFTDVDLSGIAAALAREFEPAAVARGLTLHANVAPGVFVWGDRDRLHQLGVILLDNAVRYTRAGFVTVRLVVEGHDAVLSVLDTGPGIAPEHLPRLFDRFYRVDAARSSDHGGAGLGLAIARWITEVHAGHLDVTSTPGQGTTFTVRLRAKGHGHSLPHPPRRVDQATVGRE